jgi:hypothetical protein
VHEQLACESLQEPLVVIDEEHPFHWSPFALIVNVGPCSVDSERTQVQEPPFIRAVATTAAGGADLLARRTRIKGKLCARGVSRK